MAMKKEPVRKKPVVRDPARVESYAERHRGFGSNVKPRKQR